MTLSEFIMNKRAAKNTKTDVAEKVKEIKQRQQNWFQQRNREKSDTRSTNNIQALTPEVPRTTRSPVELSSPARRVPLVGKTQVISEACGDEAQVPKKTGFQTWLDARQTDSNNFIVREGRSKSEDQCLTGGLPLSEDMFDTAAERIAARVRMEMQLGDREDGDGDMSSSNISECLMGGGSGLDSHRCRLCNKLMVAPDNSPTLLIPCGHTYCMRCINDHTKCPGCKCPIQSMTNNIMLEQIITEYARKNKEFNGSHTSSSASFRSTTKKPEKDYAAEYQRLNLRCEVLQAESEDIRKKMKELDGQVQQQERQMESIDRQEARLRVEIEEIQQRIGQLRAHKQDFQGQIEVIQGQKEEEAERLRVVQVTISQLSQDMVQVKTKAEQLNQDINR